MYNFFANVLPWTSVYNSNNTVCCYLVGMNKSNGNSEYKLCPSASPEKMELALKALKAQDDPPVDIYLAVSSFNRAAGNRKSENAIAAKSIVVDIDSDKLVTVTNKDGSITQKMICGQYHNQQESLQAALNFSKETGLRPTYIINSGRGIHLYWSFTQDIPKDKWRLISAYFELLCNTYELKIDHAVIGDSARIIRCPNTLHLSANISTSLLTPAPLQIHKPKEFILHMQDLLLAKGANLNNIKLRKDKTITTPYTGVLPTVGDTSKIDNVLTQVFGDCAPAQADAAKIVRHCAQLQQCGFASEPVWFLAAQVLSHCRNGREVFHELSAMDTARYNVTLADDKFLRGQESGYNPACCETFKQHRPELCEACPWNGKITSPISLNRLAVDPVQQPVIDNQQPVINNTIDDTDFTVGPWLDASNLDVGTYFHYKQNTTKKQQFFQNDSGIFELDFNASTGKYDTSIISNSRIIFKKLCIDDTTPETQLYYVFDIFLPGRNDPVQVTLKAQYALKQMDLASWAVASGLSLSPYQIRGFHLFMNSYLDQIRLNTSITLQRQPDAMGWQEVGGKPAFVVGDKLLFARPNPVELLYGDGRNSTALTQYQQAGDIQKWLKIPRLYKELNQPFGQLAMCLSFAAPFMAVLPQEASNCLISLYSTDGGKGKTHLAKACASVWGTSRAGFIQANSSLASKEKYLSTIHHLPIFVDEITTMDEEDVRSLVFEFINGVEKNKLNRNSTIRKTGSWSTVCMITSNYSLKEIVRSVFPESNAGVLRILEYPCDFELPSYINPTSISDIFSILDDNYGLAGPIFIEQTLNNPNCKAYIKSQVLSFVKKYNFKPEERFYSYALGLALVIGRLCVKIGLLDYDMTALEDWVIHRFIPAIHAQDGDLAADPDSDIAGLLNECVCTGLWVKCRKCPKELANNRGNIGFPDGYVLKYPTNTKNFAARLELDTGKLYIARRALYNFRKTHKKSITEITNLLKKVGTTYEMRDVLGRGTALSTTHERLIVIELPEYKATTDAELEALCTNLNVSLPSKTQQQEAITIDA